MSNGLKVFGGTANPALVQAICDDLRILPGLIRCKRFADDEISLQIMENVRGFDTFIVQPTCKPANDNLMELLLIADALRRASAETITAVLPYYGYARQDRKDRPRVPISAAVVAAQMEAVGIDRVLAIDLHSAPIQGFFKIPVDHLYALPVMVEHLKSSGVIEHLTIVSPDAGGVPRARTLAEKLKAPLAIIDKRREEANISEVMNVIGDVVGRNCLLVDDMIDTAGTLVKGAVALMQKGAASVSAWATHGVFSNNAQQRIEESPLVNVFVTDTIPQDFTTLMSRQIGPKIRCLTVSGLLAKGIESIHNRSSVSTLFV